MCVPWWRRLRWRVWPDVLLTSLSPSPTVTCRSHLSAEQHVCPPPTSLRDPTTHTRAHTHTCAHSTLTIQHTHTRAIHLVHTLLHRYCFYYFLTCLTGLVFPQRQQKVDHKGSNATIFSSSVLDEDRMRVQCSEWRHRQLQSDEKAAIDLHQQTVVLGDSHLRNTTKVTQFYILQLVHARLVLKDLSTASAPYIIIITCINFSRSSMAAIYATHSTECIVHHCPHQRGQTDVSLIHFHFNGFQRKTLSDNLSTLRTGPPTQCRRGG